jgi:hypothetical protein
MTARRNPQTLLKRHFREAAQLPAMQLIDALAPQ